MVGEKGGGGGSEEMKEGGEGEGGVEGKDEDDNKRHFDCILLGRKVMRGI